MVAASDLKSEVVMACRFESGHSYQVLVKGLKYLGVS